MWFSTVVAISAITVVAVFVMKDRAVDDGFSVGAGTFIIFFTIVAGLYWGSKCLDKTAKLFKEDIEEDLKEEGFDF